MPHLFERKPNILFLNSCVSGGGAGRSLLAYLELVGERVNSHIVLPEAGILTRHLKHKEKLHFIKEFIERPLTPPYKRIVNIPVLNALGGVYALIQSAKKIIQVIRSEDSDAIYCNHMLANPVGVVVGYLTKTPVIFHIRNIHNNLWIERWFYRWMSTAKCVTKLICNSEASAEPFKDLVPEKITVIHNFCDLTKFDISQVKPVLRKELALDKKAKIIGYVGRITGWKGIDLLIRSFAQVIKKQPQAELVIVGENDGGIKVDLKEQYRQLAAELGVGPKTHFIGFKDDIRPYVGDFDVLALPSRSPEPFGRVLVEAMALEVPAVISAHGGAIEVVDDKVDGLWSTPKDHKDMAKKLIKILKDDKLRDRMSLAASQKVRSKFDNQRLANRITEEIFSALSPESGVQYKPQSVPSYS